MCNNQIWKECQHTKVHTNEDDYSCGAKKIVNVIMFEGNLDFKVQVVDLST